MNFYNIIIASNASDEIDSVEKGIDQLDPAPPVTPALRTQGLVVVKSFAH